MSDEPVMDNRSSDEIDRFIVELEKELQQGNDAYSSVMESYNAIRRVILEKKAEMSALEIQRHGAKGITDKARENIKRLESEIRINKQQFWQAKHGGR